MFYTAPRPKGLTNLGLPWKPEDIRRLRQLVGQSKSAPEIADLMERSTPAIRSKAAQLGLHISGRRR